MVYYWNWPRKLVSGFLLVLLDHMDTLYMDSVVISLKLWIEHSLHIIRALPASVNVAELMGEVYKNVEIEPSLIQLKQPHSFFSSQQTDTEKTLLVDVSGVGVLLV